MVSLAIHIVAFVVVAIAAVVCLCVGLIVLIGVCNWIGEIIWDDRNRLFMADDPGYEDMGPFGIKLRGEKAGGARTLVVLLVLIGLGLLGGAYVLAVVEGHMTLAGAPTYR